MNRSLISLLGSLLVPSGLIAQVTVGLVLDQDQFLVGEALPVSVRITNFSGQTLSLGLDNDWLRFTLETKRGDLVPLTGDVPVKDAFDLETSGVATKHVKLGSQLPVLKPGGYRIAAVVRLQQWGRELATAPKEFDVIAGTVLWEQAFGLPVPAGESRPPEVRRYALQQAIHLKQMKLYARVTDTTGERIFALFPLGPMLTFSRPETQIDRTSNLHVLYQTGARAFNYSVVDPAGQLVGRQTYEYTATSRPTLRMDDEGKLKVTGGVRRVSRDDLPAPPVDTPPASTTPEPAKP